MEAFSKLLSSKFTSLWKHTSSSLHFTKIVSYVHLNGTNATADIKPGKTELYLVIASRVELTILPQLPFIKCFLAE